jgi:hypothetical protein
MTSRARQIARREGYQYISPPFRRFLETRTIHGATVDRLAIKEVPAFRMWVPDIEQQDHIVATLDALHSATHSLEAVYDGKLAALDELTQSVLQQAFGGELQCAAVSPSGESARLRPPRIPAVQAGQNRLTIQ